ncbi:DUF6412 domain-containing protein [Curtobacterium sp. VKM Ac-2922]|uniref:DUF6412 domain-containing protein n=1 Tax=Curtobacterium sp. VKM Ac-2922 TaxID=2929475 RepID=UPI001FB52935|nr:DUF6412 domain-containing protein [Curtobacterium sp. VKM Ac-2922]MCJ1714871.1 DUF6412 domain-containing protein [Curtobacterium sp. VKM Ac-2922]
MAVIEVFLRAVAALVVVDPVSGALPLLALAGFGAVVVAAAVLVAQVLALVLGVAGTVGLRVPSAPRDLVTRIAWSHPDADGHARPRAPGVVPAT